MKKTLVCILALALLLPLTAQAEGFLGFFFGTPSSGLTLQYVPVQDKAFVTLDGQTTARLMGTSGDGNMLLLYNPFELYLWDQRAQCRIPVSFARPEDAEAVTQLAPMAVINMIGRNLKKEQRNERMEQLTSQQEEYLAKRGLTAFANLDQIVECFPQIVQLGPRCVGISDHWALVNCVYYPCALAIDLRNGEALVFINENQPKAFCEDRIFMSEGILNLETREMTYGEQLGLMPAQNDGRPADLSFLYNSFKLCKDGSLLTIGWEGTINYEEGNSYWLVDVRTDSNRAARIGFYFYSYAPDRFLATEDERYLLLCSASGAYYKPFVIFDRENGSVTEFEASQYLPIVATKNGFLLWDLNTYDVLILDPTTCETRKVGLGSGFDWNKLNLGTLPYIIGNGQNMFFEPNSIISMEGETTYVHGYFVLEGEE